MRSERARVRCSRTSRGTRHLRAGALGGARAVTRDRFFSHSNFGGSKCLPSSDGFPARPARQSQPSRAESGRLRTVRTGRHPRPGAGRGPRRGRRRRPWRAWTRPTASWTGLEADAFRGARRLGRRRGAVPQGPGEADELAGGAAGRLVAEAVGDDPVPDSTTKLSRGQAA